MFSSHPYYIEGIKSIDKDIKWQELHSKTLLLTGATGLIGRVIVDLIMYRNEKFNDNIKLCIISRNKKTSRKIFKEYDNNNLFSIVECDLSNPYIDISNIADVDYIIHGASNTHPVAYATQPISTIMTTVNGTKTILDIASMTGARTLFMSTVEIYGENRGDIERFTENYMGYIDCNTLRAGYPEGKRVAEALIQAYKEEKHTDTIIARLGRVFGPTTAISDSKSTTQFIEKALNGQNIVLKSAGNQEYSMIYVMDAVGAILRILLEGVCGEAYNVSNDEIINLKTVAKNIAESVGVKVVFDLPSDDEQAGFSVVSRALMDNSKLKNLGWASQWTLEKAYSETIKIMRYERKLI